MAERRMFARSVVESAKFLKMPVSSQNLYFHLGMNADDDGIVEGYSVIHLVNANEDDLKVLYGRGFVKILNEDLVTYITDWREQNKLRADRKKDSMYAGLLMQEDPSVKLLEKKERSDLVKKSGPSTDGKRTAQCSVGEDSIGEDRIGECSGTDSTRYQSGDEIITEGEYRELTDRYPSSIVDKVINRILLKRYHGCLNSAKISEWCAEKLIQETSADSPERTARMRQLQNLAEERKGDACDK